MRGLIIGGYGRAGGRHVQIAAGLGHSIGIVDPASVTGFPNIEDASKATWFAICYPTIEAALKVAWDYAVIATPPDLHLIQIHQCLDADLPVLCEKPLCSLGQLAEAELLLEHPNANKVMVAYNYRFHPALKIVKGRIPSMMVCRQQRVLPAWGLLLDHCSHDLDILDDICGPLTVKWANRHQCDHTDEWTICVETTIGQLVIIQESVGQYTERVARLIYLNGDTLDIDPDPAMFAAMWAAFMRGECAPGLQEAIYTQRLLEQCKELVYED